MACGGVKGKERQGKNLEEGKRERQWVRDDRRNKEGRVLGRKAAQKDKEGLGQEGPTGGTGVTVASRLRWPRVELWLESHVGLEGAAQSLTCHHLPCLHHHSYTKVFPPPCSLAERVNTSSHQSASCLLPRSQRHCMPHSRAPRLRCRHIRHLPEPRPGERTNGTMKQ